MHLSFSSFPLINEFAAITVFDVIILPFKTTVRQPIHTLSPIIIDLSLLIILPSELCILCKSVSIIRTSHDNRTLSPKVISLLQIIVLLPEIENLSPKKQLPYTQNFEPLPISILFPFIVTIPATSHKVRS